MAMDLDKTGLQMETSENASAGQIAAEIAIYNSSNGKKFGSSGVRRRLICGMVGCTTLARDYKSGLCAKHATSLRWDSGLPTLESKAEVTPARVSVVVSTESPSTSTRIEQRDGKKFKRVLGGRPRRLCDAPHCSKVAQIGKAERLCKKHSQGPTPRVLAVRPDFPSVDATLQPVNADSVNQEMSGSAFSVLEPHCCDPLPLIFCGKCKMSLEEPCWTHATRFPDKYVVPYAVASLPEQLYLDVSAEKPGKSVFAKEFLPSHSVFGPLVAPLSESGTQFSYAVRSESDQKIRSFQLDSDLSSNWMKYVRFAHEPFEQNVAVYSVGVELFFVTTVAIFPEEELKVGYSMRYAKSMDIRPTDGAPTERSDFVGRAATCTPDTLTLTNLEADEPPSPDPPVENFLENNWQTFCIVPAPALWQIASPDLAVVRKSPECVEKRRKRPRPAGDADNLLAETPQLPQAAEETPLVKRKRKRKRSALPTFPGEKRQPCFLCGKTIIHMGDHIKRKHPELTCRECDKEFSTVKDLLNHITESHPLIVPAAVKAAREEAVDFMKRTGFVQYKCSKCLNVYPSKQLLDLHDYYHTGETDGTLVPQQCPACQFIAATFSELVQHVSWHALGKKQKRSCLLCDHRACGLGGHMRAEHPAEMQIIKDGWKFGCLECHAKYPTDFILHRHIDKVHKGFLCLCCGMRVPGTAAYDRHVEQHRVDGAFRCRLCGALCVDYLALYRHFGEMHQEDVRIKCHLCQTFYRTVDRLSIHMEQRHSLEQYQQDNEAIQADSCLPVSDMDYDTLPKIPQSVPDAALIPCLLDGSSVGGFPDETTQEEDGAGHLCSPVPADVDKPQKAKKRFKRKCQLCDCNVFDLEQHIQHSHPDCKDVYPYACIHCPKRYHFERDLRKHAGHAAHPMPTKAIPAAALQEAIEHIKRTGTFSYYCSKCRVSYQTKTLLVLHEFMHKVAGVEEPSERDCPECGYIAPSFKELIGHVPVHGMKPRDMKPCLLCGDRFAKLKDHARIRHSELIKIIGSDWEYKCKECGDKFKRNSDLELHLRSVHKGFQCWYCAIILYKTKEFTIHIQEHKVNDAYPCPSCDKAFPTYSRLNNHYRGNHDLTNAKTCVICRTVCLGTTKLAQHMHNVHNMGGNTTVNTTVKNRINRFKYGECKKGMGPDGRFPCEECGKVLASYGTLHRHKRWAHTHGMKEKYYKKKAEEKERGVESRWRTYVKPKYRLKLDEFPHRCAECQKGFVHKGHLISHNETCHKDQATTI